MKMTTITASTAVNVPPGSDASASCTRFSPPSPRNTRLKTLAPSRITNTIEEIVSVVRITSRRMDRLKLRLSAESSMAPTAPTEADSVGVAMPVRIDPSTASISSSGGASALTTRPARPARRSSLIASGGHERDRKST
jgi:hypothetical protein